LHIMRFIGLLIVKIDSRKQIFAFFKKAV
jgi:hypothetical protein